MAAIIKRPQEGFQTKFTRSNADIFFGGGTLNPQPKYSHVLTPTGFIRISQIEVGDEIIGLENHIQKVTNKEYMGPKDCIRITLEDSSECDCALDHKWWVRKGGTEQSVISFELLEAFQVSKENGTDFDVEIFKYSEERMNPVKILKIDDIGKKECYCISVSNSDQMYVTDSFMATMNCGKSQPLSCKVLTPTGWVRMGDLKEGDVICDVRGGTQTVLNVYDKGIREVYEIEFEDGKTRCCAEHLWRVTDFSNMQTSILSTEELLATGYRRYFITCCRPVAGTTNGEFLIHPYTMGRLVGKGTTGDINISDAMRMKLAAIGVTDKMFIPDIYRFADETSRKQLLQGFVDEAVNTHPNRMLNVLRFTIPEHMYIGIADIVHSLGGKLLIQRELKKGLSCVMVLPIPVNYVSDDGVMHNGRIVRRSIRSIKKTFDEPCRCIRVSSPEHLYITDDYIVTHNTYAAILSVAEPSLDPKFRAAFTRRNLGNLKQGGGIIDDFKDAYGDYLKVTASENPRITFPSGSFVDCLHIADETPSKLMERAKGWQYDYIYMDELTSYEFSTFRILGTRNRGKAMWSGHLAGTTNPKRSHWTRKMLDPYVGPDGFIIPEMDGVVMYYYLKGEGIDDVVMGRTKEEVYTLCKTDIDRKLKRLAGKSWTYKDMIRSFVFYAGKMSENKASIGNNSSYIGSVTAVGGKRAQQLIEGNFNVDEDEEDDIPIASSDAQAVFVNDPCTNGDNWITVDLADLGTDNVVALHWNGLHVDDIMIITNSTPRKNYERIKLFAKKHGTPDSHVIYDGTHGSYMYDYMPEAQPFISAGSAVGLYALQADRLKDECYLRLIDVIKGRRMSFSTAVAKSRYIHQNLKNETTVQDEFLEECAVVRMQERPSGKKKLMSKKEMNAKLGRNRSMDLLDPCAMRMYPLLQFQYGDELSKTQIVEAKHEESEGTVNVWDSTVWC